MVAQETFTLCSNSPDTDMTGSTGLSNTGEFLEVDWNSCKIEKIGKMCKLRKVIGKQVRLVREARNIPALYQKKATTVTI